MCGVAGLLCLDPLCQGETHESLVKRMCDVQFHRGPDDGGVTALGPACLGARRLSILDLSAAGHMPMSDTSGRWWITYNGEVYNFRELRRELEAACHTFRSHTDTEVVLHAYMEWGEQCLERFIGMFAFAIYDRETGRLVLGRDRYGVKPLYYARKNGHVLFASEVKALTEGMQSVAVDTRRLIEWFLYRNIDALSSGTLIEGVSSVMPGCVVTVGPDGITSKRVYHLTDHVSADECRRLAELPPGKVVDEVDAAVSEAVRLRLVSDVPVGTLLSGGLDSSLVTAIAAKQTKDLTAFNVSVAGYADLDERRHAEVLARKLGIPLVSIDFTAQRFRQELVRSVQLSDFPLTHPNSIAYHLICRAAREKGVLVLLSGEGADELFGGYAWAYRRRWYLERLRPLLDRVPESVWSAAALLTFARFDLPVTSAAFRDLLPSAVDLIDRYERLGWRDACEEAYAFVHHRPSRVVFGALLAELYDFLSPLLRRLDRMSMGGSVECRVPFLDHRLVHLAINLPIDYRVGTFSDKWVLRQVAARHLPAQFARRKKMGFPLPLADYVAPFAHRRFFADGFCEQEFALQRRGVDRLVHMWRQRTLPFFGMVTLEIWGRLFVRREDPAAIEQWLAQFDAAASGAPAAAHTTQDVAARQRRGTRQLLLGRAWFIVAGYVVSVVLARALTPADYGVYGVLVSFVSWLGMLIAAGIPGATSKLLAGRRNDASSVERSARLLLLGLGALIFATCWIAAPAIASFFHLPEAGMLVRIAILDLPFLAIYSAYQGILGGHRRFGVLAGAQVVYGVTKLAGVLGLLALGLSLERVLLVNASTSAVVCAFLVLRYPVPHGRTTLSGVRTLALAAIPMGIYLVAGQVLVNLDLWSLKRLWQGGGDVVGYYVASLNLGKTLLIIPTVQSAVLLASVAWALADHDRTAARRHIQEATRFALVLAAPACALLGADAATLLGTLFSSPYAAGGRFLELQLVGFALFGLLDAYAVCLIATGRPWLAAQVLLGVIPVVVLANTVLIPRFGGTGAAASLIIGTGLGLAVMATLAYRRFGALVAGRTLARVALAAGVVAVLAHVIDTPGPLVFVKIAVLGVLYLLILGATGEISRSDFGLPAAKGPSAPAPADDPPTVAPGPRS